MKRNRNGIILTILELLVVLLIIAFILYKAMQGYSKNRVSDKGTQNFLSEQGIATAGPKEILDSTKKKIQDINSKAAERQGE